MIVVDARREALCDFDGKSERDLGMTVDCTSGLIYWDWEGSASRGC